MVPSVLVLFYLKKKIIKCVYCSMTTIINEYCFLLTGVTDTYPSLSQITTHPITT